MAAIESLLDREIVRELVKNGHRTFEEISEILQEEFPNKRGLSVKSLKRYCHMHEIKRRQNVADNELDEVVKSAVYKSGTGTRGRGHWDACVGTWDLGTRGEGRGDIWYGTRGRMGRGDVKCRGRGR